MSKGNKKNELMSLAPLTDRYELPPAGKKLLAIVAQPEARTMTVTDICKLAEISRDSYYRLYKDERFQKAYYEACRITSIQAAMPAMHSLAAQAALGDIAAAKIILELNALYSPTATLNINQDIESKPTLKDLLQKKEQTE